MTSRALLATLPLATLPLAAVLALASGCGGGDDDPAAKPSTIPTPSGLVAPIQAGTVAGRLVSSGGPNGDKTPLAGTVRLTAESGSVVTTPVGADGRFRVGVSPGAYTITGTSPDVNDGKQTCSAAKATTVTADGTAVIEVVCAIR